MLMVHWARSKPERRWRPFFPLSATNSGGTHRGRTRLNTSRGRNRKRCLWEDLLAAAHAETSANALEVHACAQMLAATVHGQPRSWLHPSVSANAGHTAPARLVDCVIAMRWNAPVSRQRRVFGQWHASAAQHAIVPGKVRKNRVAAAQSVIAGPCASADPPAWARSIPRWDRQIFPAVGIRILRIEIGKQSLRKVVVGAILPKLIEWQQPTARRPACLQQLSERQSKAKSGWLWWRLYGKNGLPATCRNRPFFWA